MFTYTRYMIERNRLPVDVMTEDLYHSGMADEILSIKTYYEMCIRDRIVCALPQMFQSEISMKYSYL